MCSFSENLCSLRQAVFTRLLPCDWLVWCLCSQASPLYTLARQYWNCDIFLGSKNTNWILFLKYSSTGRDTLSGGHDWRRHSFEADRKLEECERSLWLRNLLDLHNKVSNDLFCQTSKSLFFLLSFFPRTQTSIFKGVSGSVADANERWTDISLLLRPLCCLVAD